MGQIDVHLLGCQLQVHRGYAPGTFDAQNPPVKLTIFHGYWMNTRGVGVHAAQLTGGCTRGGQRSVLKPLLWGEPPAFGGVGGTLPPRLSLGGGNGKGGESNSLLPQGDPPAGYHEVALHHSPPQVLI